MKTAMQELIEYLEKDYYINELTNFDKDKIQFLEKEKEQLIKAHIDGFDHIVVDFKKQEYAEQYYNQTYNQDRITISETRRSIEGIGLLKKQSEGVEWWWKNQNL